ncbi:TPA: hypothetical protein PXQ68_002666 [Yersinia enterocolitica]|nr:hypothetical protein [Yersinia enterocolitica]
MRVRQPEEQVQAVVVVLALEVAPAEERMVVRPRIILRLAMWSVVLALPSMG